MIYRSIKELIGNTPILALENIDKSNRIFVKVEFFNPGLSIKDRAALFMLKGAEERGEIGPNTVIIEPSSWNTGIGLAMIGAIEGRRTIITMPESMSIERRKSISVYGAEIVLTPAVLGMNGAIEEALRLHKEIKDSYIPMQFKNKDNSKAHKLTTAREIFEEMPDVSYIVGGVGSGGTLMGINDYIKENGLSAKIVAVEPENSAVLSGEPKGAHGIQGIGAGFIPELVRVEEYERIIKISDSDAFFYASMLAKREGLLVGISAGAAVAASINLAKSTTGKILAILPDTGTRYLSMEKYE